MADIPKVFDQYRFNSVTVIARPRNNALDVTSAVAIPPLYVVIDYDDDSALASAAAAGRYDNVMVVAPYESFKRVFVPRLSKATYTGAFTGQSSEEPCWLDCAILTTRHYGMKAYMATSGTAVVWDLDIRANMSFRYLH